MDLTLNGRPVSVELRPGMSLLELLREELGVTSVKDGCAPEGSCGACTVLMDGKAVVSCAQKAEHAAGRHVVTQEGLAPQERERRGRGPGGRCPSPTGPGGSARGPLGTRGASWRLATSRT